jgi:hypothetical protein
MSELQELKAELTRLQARVDELERTETGDAQVSRRAAFKALGAAAVGAAAGSIAFAAPAGATDGGNVVIGNDTQSAESPTVLRVENGTTWTNPAGLFGGLGITDIATADLPAEGLSSGALFGWVDGSEFPYAIVGRAEAGGLFGGYFSSAESYGMAAFGATGLKVGGDDYSMKLQSNGTLDRTVGGGNLLAVDGTTLWWNTDNSGNQRWRRLAAPNSAGAFSAITPARVYDSRWSGVAGVTTGVLNTGEFRDISVADGRGPTGTVTAANAVPAGARAVAYNLTITGTAGGGFLAVSPGGTSTSASTINWSATGIDLANASIVGTSSTRTIRVTAGGPGSTNFIVDVGGYWL